MYTQAYGGAGAIAPAAVPEHAAANADTIDFFLVREKGGFVRTLRTPLGYVPDYRAKFQETFNKSTYVHERGNSRSTCEGIVSLSVQDYLICTDGRTEEAYLRKSDRAEFKLGLPKLTFDSSKIALLSASLKQEHP